MDIESHDMHTGSPLHHPRSRMRNYKSISTLSRVSIEEIGSKVRVTLDGEVLFEGIRLLEGDAVIGNKEKQMVLTAWDEKTDHRQFSWLRVTTSKTNITLELRVNPPVRYPPGDDRHVS